MQWNRVSHGLLQDGLSTAGRKKIDEIPYDFIRKRLTMVTGENRYVASLLAGTVGLDPKAILTGDDLSKMNPELLWNHVRRTDFFVEVDPQQKEQIVRALQRAGHAVGYMGGWHQ